MQSRAQLLLHSSFNSSGVQAEPHQRWGHDRDRAETKTSDERDELAEKGDRLGQEPSDETDEKGAGEPDGPVSLGVRGQVT